LLVDKKFIVGIENDIL
jgi:hypothetical protein